MDNERIITLERLIQWNINPTDVHPIVMEWFLDWIFDSVIKKDYYETFVIAIREMVKFSIICNKSTESDALELTCNNLGYWNCRASKDCHARLKIYLERFTSLKK